MFVLYVHCVIFFFIICEQDQQDREQKQRDAKDWKIQEFWREREKEREIESAMIQPREKEKEKDILHDRERETELLKKEKQRLDQQSSSHEKNSNGLKDGKNLIMTKISH